jgi:S1-C subfamily serine protease
VSQHRTLSSTLKRFAIMGALAVAALIAISAMLIPRSEDPPVIIDHGPDHATTAALSGDETTALRSGLDVLKTDQEVSTLSANAVAAVAPAVVVVHRSGDNGTPEAIGSGVAISESGYILASLGTTGDEGSVQVTWPSGITVDARIVRIDPRYQVVLLQTPEPPEAIAPLARYSSRTGDRILAIGSPLEDFTSTVTGGIVGAIGLTLPATIDQPEIPNLIQHDAAVNDGNEGGPIVDLNGNVVGINIGSIVQLGEEIVQGWSFAVPISVLETLMANLD